jgi:hypothetical protein
VEGNLLLDEALGTQKPQWFLNVVFRSASPGSLLNIQILGLYSELPKSESLQFGARYLCLLNLPGKSYLFIAKVWEHLPSEVSYNE